MKTFRLEVVTPDRTVYDGPVIAIRVPAEGGSLGILAHHAPLVCTLETGVVHITEPDGGVRYLMTGDGFLEVKDNHARILAEVGEREEHIDLERAAAAEKRARERLRERLEADFDLARAEAALARALIRQKILRDLVPLREQRRKRPVA
jgi:F-type H+-transporting ATPase subunit epsilon